MRVNLKTFPKGLLEQKNGEFAVTKWKEDFEAELRQMIVTAQPVEGLSQLLTAMALTRINTIKEILGETK